MKTSRWKRALKPPPPFSRLVTLDSILHLLSIRVKWAGVWGKITPMKRGVLMKHQKCVCNSQRVYPKPPNILNLLLLIVFGLNVQVSGVKMGRFHKVLPSVKSAYVTLQNFTPDFQKFYTDISAVSATLCNSGKLTQKNWKPGIKHFLKSTPCMVPCFHIHAMGLPCTLISIQGFAEQVEYFRRNYHRHR